MEEDLRAQSRRVAALAAEAAKVTCTDHRRHDELAAASALFDVVWGRRQDAGTILTTEALTAIVHAGGQVTGAWRDELLVGATAALLGRDHDTGTLFLHSHVTGVVSAAQKSGVGRALKQHQRAWALARGIEHVRWTFDPLIRRNAVFNLCLLGARAVDFAEDVYGPMPDARNAGLPTDRLVVDWDLTERRVVAASEGRPAEPRLEPLRAAGAGEILRAGPDGAPLTGPVEGLRLLARIPEDIETVRLRDRDLAALWAQAVRETLGAAVLGGYRVTGITRDGWYLLTAEDRTAELAGDHR